MQKYLKSCLAVWMMLCSVWAYAATQEQIAQQQLQQNVQMVLSVAKDKSLNEQQRIIQIEHYAYKYMDYELIYSLAL